MSKNYSKVRMYYIKKLWTKKQVYDAVGSWITEQEYKLITGEEYSDYDE